MTVRLFFVVEECSDCSRHRFDFKTEDWVKTSRELTQGDHVVVDGTEMVFLGANSKGIDVYRELDDKDEEMWDYSTPDEAKIEKVSHEAYLYKDPREDPYLSPSGMYAVSTYI